MKRRVIDKRVYCGAALTALIIAMGTATDARAQFDVPTACRVGTGSYSGDLSGECSYSTCIRSLGGQAVEAIDITFERAFAVEVTGFGDAPRITFDNRAPTDAGGITVNQSTTSEMELSEIAIDAQFGTCGITGTWTISHPPGRGPTVTGTFSIEGTGAGEDCNDTVGGGGGGALCGTFGGFGLAVPFIAGAIGRRRIRRWRRVSINVSDGV